jgi:hypothetical protein
MRGMEPRRLTLPYLVLIVVAVALSLVIIDGCQEITGIGPDIHFVPGGGPEIF